MLHLAVEGVRPFYRELLRKVRTQDRLFRFAETWRRGLLEAERIDQEEPKIRQEKFREGIAGTIAAQRPPLAVRPAEVIEAGS